MKFLCLGATLILLGGVNYSNLVSVAVADENQIETLTSIPSADSTEENQEIEPLLPDANSDENTEIKPLPPPDADSTETQDNPAQTTTPSNEVILIESGSEPRQELRFTPAVNTKETTEVTMAMDINAIIDGVPVPQMPYPNITTSIVTEVTDIDAQDNIYVDFAYEDVSVAQSDAIDPASQETIEQELEYLEEIEGQLVMDSQGKIIDFQLNLPENAEPYSQQLLDQFIGSIEQLSHPFPSEPVGVGAVWQVVSNLDTGLGLEIQQTATYRLTKLHEQRATLEVTVEQQALNESISLPDLPPDMTIDLTNFSSSGNGRVIMSLEQVMPLASTIYSDTAMSMAMQEPTSGQEFTMQMNTQFQMDMLAQP